MSFVIGGVILIIAAGLFSASADASTLPDPNALDVIPPDLSGTDGDILDSLTATIEQGINAVTQSSFSSQIIAFAQAIGVAEGFGPAGNLPTMTNNPGDLSKGDFGDTGQYRTAGDGEQVIVYNSIGDGWNALYRKLQNIVDGNSSVYNLDMTILQMGAKYSGNAQTWAGNVARALGVSPNTLLSQVLS